METEHIKEAGMLYAYRITPLVYLCACMITISACAVKRSKPIIERTKTMSEHNKAQQNPQKPHRPQEPKPPYPYHEEEVCYPNQKAGITISGTLTKPQGHGSYPVVLLIAGMGPNDRNATSHFGHKPFLVLADHLTRQRIAVLRVDKRGVGKSTGVFDTTVTGKDLADDVRAGIEYLKTRSDIDASKIGLIGHSEGGMIAAMVAVAPSDVAFVIFMAGAMVTDVQASIEHTALQLHADGASEEMVVRDRVLREKVFGIISQEKDAELAQSKTLAIIDQYWADLPETFKEESAKLLFAFTKANAASRIAMYNSSWYRFFFAYRPADALKNITVPVLAVNGELDWISAPSITFPVIAQALGQAGNTDYTLATLPQLNHSLQTCQTGAIAEYATLEETMAPQALSMMSDWIVKRMLL